MKIIDLKKNKGQYSKGFTLVETMFAVVILTFTIVALMTVVASSLFEARYARDEVTVNYLLQEVIDAVRNDRDTTVFLSANGNWNDFLSHYTQCSNESTGCYFDVLSPNSTPKQCNIDSGCPYLYYNQNADVTPYYVNDDGSGMTGMAKTSFQRKIVVKVNGSNPDEIDVTVTISWLNGGMALSRSLNTSFLKWQQTL